VTHLPRQGGDLLALLIAVDDEDRIDQIVGGDFGFLDQVTEFGGFAVAARAFKHFKIGHWCSQRFYPPIARRSPDRVCRSPENSGRIHNNKRESKNGRRKNPPAR